VILPLIPHFIFGVTSFCTVSRNSPVEASFDFRIEINAVVYDLSDFWIMEYKQPFGNDDGCRWNDDPGWFFAFVVEGVFQFFDVFSRRKLVEINVKSFGIN